MSFANQDLAKLRAASLFSAVQLALALTQGPAALAQGAAPAQPVLTQSPLNQASQNQPIGQSQTQPPYQAQYQPLGQRQAQSNPAMMADGRSRAAGAGSESVAGNAGGLIVTTTPKVDGYHVRRYLGIVRGVRVFQPTVGENIRASLKGIIGGNIGAYGEMCEKARQQAYDQMIERSTALGADAVLGVHFDSSSFGGNSSEMGTEIICYGTAVLLEADR